MTAPSPAAWPLSDETGTYPALAGCVPAQFWQRAGARVLDVILGTLISYLPGMLTIAVAPLHPQAAFVVFLLCIVGYGFGGAAVYMATGYLIGGRLLGLRQVRVRTGGAPGVAGIGKYLIAWLISTPTAGIGYLIMVAVAKPPLRRAWHDIASGLIVLDVRAGRDPRRTPVPVYEPEPARPTTGHGGIVAVDASAFGQAGLANRGDDRAFVPSAGLPPAPEPGPIAMPAPGPAKVDGPGAFGGSGGFGGPGGFDGPPPAPPAPAPAPVDPVGPGTPGGPVLPDGLVTSLPWGSPADAPEFTVTTGYRDPDGEAGAGMTVLAPATPTGPARSGPPLLMGDDGSRIVVVQDLVLGRDPAAPAGHATATSTPLPDSTMSLSKTHAAVGPDPEGVWVEDLHSTNGTGITTASGVWIKVEPGSRATVPYGAQLHFGRRTFKVVQQ